MVLLVVLQLLFSPDHPSPPAHQQWPAESLYSRAVRKQLTVISSTLGENSTTTKGEIDDLSDKVDGILIWLCFLHQTHRPQWLDCLTVCGRLFFANLHHAQKFSLSSLITSSTNGYDGSMMNGLQSLPQWESAFGFPTGGKLGLLNAIQVNPAFMTSGSELC